MNIVLPETTGFISSHVVLLSVRLFWLTTSTMQSHGLWEVISDLTWTFILRH